MWNAIVLSLGIVIGVVLSRTDDFLMISSGLSITLWKEWLLIFLSSISLYLAFIFYPLLRLSKKLYQHVKNSKEEGPGLWRILGISTQGTSQSLECESIHSLDSLFPSTRSRLSSRQALHIFHKSRVLIDLILVKVPKFTESRPVFFLDFDSNLESEVKSLLSPVSNLEDLSQDFEVLAATTNLAQFEEGQRVYLEEEGNMVYDPDLTDSLTGYVSFVDPRSRFMGSRIISVEGCVETQNPKDLNYYQMWRITHGISEGPPVVSSNPQQLNFQYFNGEKGEESEVCTFAAAVYSNGKDELDLNYSKNLKSLRVLDSFQKFVGVIFDQYLNFCLIKLFERPTSELYLETGEKMNAWKPLYSDKS